MAPPFSCSVLFLILLCCNARAGERIPDNPYAYDVDRSCGMRCCAFLDRFLGGKHTFREIVSIREPESRGSSFEDLVATLNSLGHETLPIEGALEDVRSFNLPAILAVKRGARSHYIVFLPRRSDNVTFFVFDPPADLKGLSATEMQDIYQGHALVVGDATSIAQVKSRVLRVNQDKSRLEGVAIVFIVVVLSGGVAAAFRWLRRREAVVTKAVLVMACLAFTSCNGDSQQVFSDTADVLGANMASAGDSDGGIQLVDVGDVEEGTPVTAEAVFINHGQTPFAVTSIDKSCSCQSVNLSNEGAVLPGDSLRVTTMINTTGMSGRFEKSVTLSTSSKTLGREKLAVVIRGSVTKELAAIPEQVFVGQVSHSAPVKATITVLANVDGIIETLRDIKSSSESITARIIGRSSKKLTVEITVAEGGWGGAFMETVTFEFNHDRHPSLNVLVTGHRSSVLRAIPRVVYLENVQVSSTKKLRIDAQDGREFEITRIS